MFLSHVRQATTAPPATTQLAQSAAVKLRNALPVRMLKALSNWALGRTARLPLTARAAAVGKRRGAASANALTGPWRGGAPGTWRYHRRRISPSGVPSRRRPRSIRPAPRRRWGRGDDLGHVLCFSRKLLSFSRTRKLRAKRCSLCSKGGACSAADNRAVAGDALALPKEQRGPAKTDLCRSLCASILPVAMCLLRYSANSQIPPQEPVTQMALVLRVPQVE